MLCALLAATPEDELSAIVHAQEEYNLPAYYRLSRAFLRTHARHEQAPIVRYELAMQLVASSLAKPASRDADEARKLLREIWASKDDEDRRFSAALMLVKFAREKEQLALAAKVIEDFPANNELPQVYLWLVPELERRRAYGEAARVAAEALARWPQLPEAEEMRRAEQRGRLIGTKAPFTPAEWAEVKSESDVVLVDFWATWCAPCIAGHQLLKPLAARGLSIVEINVDEEAAVMRAFRETNTVPWKSLRFDDVEAIQQRFGINVLPATFLVDREGVILELDPKHEELERRLRRTNMPKNKAKFPR